MGCFGLSCSLGAQTLIVSVQTSLPSPQPIETPITLTMSATDTNVNPGILNYKVEVSAPSSSTFRTVHDFAEGNTFIWGRNIVVGTYQIRVTARDSNYLTQTADLVIPFTIPGAASLRRALYAPCRVNCSRARSCVARDPER